MINNGFVVKNDRFHLEDASCYILEGWLVPGTEIRAFLDKEPLDVTVETLSEEIDEREHGQEARLRITVPEDTTSHKMLKVYANGQKRRLCFRINVADMEEKRQGIRCFIDDFYINTQDDLCRIQGWCIAKHPVEIAVADINKKKIDCEIERFNRKDVVSLFEEYEVEARCGFHIEMHPIPQQKVYLLMRAEEERLVKAIETSSLLLKKKKISNLVQKGMDYLQYNGMGAFVQKSFKKVVDTKDRPIPYSKWIQKHLPSLKELEEQKKYQFLYRPKISIVIPLYKTPEKYLCEMIDSVLNQSYSNWELCLSDGSGEDSPLTELLKQYEKKDSRIKVVYNNRQLHIAENTNEAIKIATGDFIAFSDHDDLLTPDAMFHVAKAVNENMELEVLYSDEDKVSAGNKFMQPHMKPDFNIDLLRTVNYICHLFVVKKTMIDKVGMLRPEFDGAQDYDFILRCVEATNRIYHIPRILYHWRFFEGSTAENPESKLYAFEAGKRAIEAHYERVGIRAEVVQGEFLGLYRTRYIRDKDPLVSILIPNKDHTDDLDRCIRSIEEKSTYHNYEYIIIENNSDQEETFAYYKKLEEENPKAHVVYWDGEFNYSAINNYGASFANGEYMLLLNNDVEVINADWMEEMLGYCMREDVGIVGARLYYPDDTIQHAGVVIGFGGIAGHAFVQQKRGATGYCHRIICAQDYSAVTAACMMVKKSVFEEVGGLTEELKVAFNDVDFCMKVRQAGKLVVYNPYAELYHYESKSRGLEDTPEKVARFNSEIKKFSDRWPEILKNGDPYYNPNLTLKSQDFSLRRI
ncbi:MAG: glycosyltransferase family 2 protein [Eubacteriales bacterium]|nr:glycosyltransferase family 2 protein [Eubacteriales bacterium]